MKTKNTILASMILITFHIVLTMVFSCGIVNKQKSKSSISRNMEVLNSEKSSEKNEQQYSEWQNDWMQQHEYSRAWIYSDSTITYYPDGGFQLARGNLLFSQLNQKETSSEEGILQNRANITEINKLQQEHEKEENKAVLSNKENRFPVSMIWILLIALIFTLLYERILRALK